VNWFKQLKHDDFDICDKEHFGCPATVEEDELRKNHKNDDGKYFD